jgi:riboflavin kinase/FMN adenylyltransferase
LKVYANFPHDLPVAPPESVVTLGVFDGLHVGHQRILETALAIAASRPVVVVTFDPHPRAVLGPAKHNRLLAPIPERLELLAAWPLGAVAILRFDQSIASQSYEDFVRTALVDGLGARHLVLGHDMRLGRGREGTPERLAALGAQLGYGLELVPAVQVDGETVSSTLIRHRLDAGDVAGVARFLGRPYALGGTVVRGRGRGRALGIPTANLDVGADKLIPADGVYAARVRCGGAVRAGAVNIGVLPTFGAGARRSVEIHVLDWEGDLYGDRLRFDLLQRLRDERRFESPAALVAQIHADLEAVRRLEIAN